MGFKIKLRIKAKFDIRENIEYYNKKKNKLGKRFYKHLISTFQILKYNPYTYAVRYRNIRIAKLNKFPFLVHYIIDEKNKIVIILSIMSTHRNPDLWNAN